MSVISRRQLLAAAGAGFALVLAGAAAGQVGSLQTFEKSSLEVRAASGTHRFTIEVARTAAQHAQGLMYRRRLAADTGMLFIYDKPEPARFWMKNTYIPLDMVFIAPDGRISSIAERTVPLSLELVTSNQPVIGVLELNGGTASRLGIRAGDRVIFPALGAGG
jgi:hypothetical protein